MPDDYYVSRYSGEEIDDLLGKANAAVRYDAAQSLTAVQQHTAQKNIGTTWPCNPNLLDNWYFGNPVNQRGQTSYSGDAVYTIDRWITLGGNSAITVGDAYIGVKKTNAGGDNGRLTQRLAEPKRLSGQTVTFSILTHPSSNCTGGSIHILKGTANYQVGISASNGVGQHLISVTANIPTTDVPNAIDNRVQISVNVGDLKVFAVKLELGDTQTLAHKEGDTWVLNEIPDYGEQLRRCQRYFVRLRQYAIARAAQIVSDHIDFSVATPVPMRVLPAILGGEFFVASTSVITVGGFSFSVAAQSDNILRIRAAKPGHGLSDAVLEVSNYIDLSADL